MENKCNISNMKHQNLNSIVNIQVFNGTFGPEKALHAIKIYILKILKLLQKSRLILDPKTCLASTNLNSMAWSIPEGTCETFKLGNLNII